MLWLQEVSPLPPATMAPPTKKKEEQGHKSCDEESCATTKRSPVEIAHIYPNFLIHPKSKKLGPSLTFFGRPRKSIRGKRKYIPVRAIIQANQGHQFNDMVPVTKVPAPSKGLVLLAGVGKDH